MTSTKRYVITSAQKKTDVHADKLYALLDYCDNTNAELMVLPMKYTTSWKSDFGYDPEVYDIPDYDPEIQEYILSRGTRTLNSNLMVHSKIHAIPTTQDPLNGLDAVSFDKSCIYAGVKHRLKTVPTPGHKLPKILCTTGAITVPNYSKTCAGAKAEYYHTYGAVVVEVTDNKVFHLRQIVIDKNDLIYDLDKVYEYSKKPRTVRAAGLIYGDLHHIWADPGVLSATFSSKDSMLKVLKPKKQGFHDFIDFFSGNHHHVGDRLLEHLKRKHNKDVVYDELLAAFEFLGKYTPKDTQTVLIASNHNDATDRWLNSGRGDSDPVNAPIYHLLNYYKYKYAALKGASASTINPLEAFMNRFLPELKSKIKFLSRDESFKVKGIECGYHGDVGPNGARGNVKSFANIGCKTITGHSHSPQIFNHAMQVGTSSLMKLGYNSGPSSWLHTHGIIYENGERSLINVIGDSWRA